MSSRQTATVLAAVTVGVLLAGPTAAATWITPLTAPTLDQLVIIDKTGEPGWIYGEEDVAGDGNTFQQAEQAADFRTVYAATDATRFWLRAYVSDATAVATTVTAYVFIDNDKNAATGGPANAAEIDPKLTSDPTPGGYEYVIAIRGNGTINQIWQWQQAMTMFTATNPMPAEASAEIGTDIDPILILDSHQGYLQASVALDAVGLAEVCGANLFVRSANSAAMGGSDLDVGLTVPCVPVDADGDGVPDAVVPTVDCTTDDQCPLQGSCVEGTCVLPQPCKLDTDCAANEHCMGGTCVSAQPCSVDTDCAADERCDAGKCVPKPGGPCDGNADCDDLVCTEGVCNACSQTDDRCGPGRHCGPDGRCAYDDEDGSGGIPLDPGDEVRGGACTCRAAGEPSNPGGAVAIGLFAVTALLSRRRRRCIHEGST